MTPTLTRDGAHILAAILDDPADDLPRLAYADWLEEQSQCERAGFIRAQLRLAANPVACWRVVPQRLSPDGGVLEVPPAQVPHQLKPGDHLVFKPPGGGRRRPVAHPVEAVMHGGIGEPTRIGYGPPVRPAAAYAAFADREATKPLLYKAHVTGSPAWARPIPGMAWDEGGWERGFLQRARCPLESWLKHGAGAVSSHPVRRVAVMNREPAEGRDWFGWYMDGSDAAEIDCLPDEVWHALDLPRLSPGSLFKYADTREAAISALSDALLLYAGSRHLTRRRKAATP